MASGARADPVRLVLLLVLLALVLVLVLVLLVVLLPGLRCGARTDLLALVPSAWCCWWYCCWLVAAGLKRIRRAQGC
uniref:hypothetical protein n=1 Tax=Marinobacterium profundum TaxID=1714300 RepID=UPI0013153BA8|nr:hypothetical protein [Marinobacterium profundum]